MQMDVVTLEEGPNPLAYSLANRLYDEVLRVLQRDGRHGPLLNIQLIRFDPEAETIILCSTGTFSS